MAASRSEAASQDVRGHLTAPGNNSHSERHGLTTEISGLKRSLPLSQTLPP
jgi:hypothetical protein